ncbi:Ig-like domain-containing protein [Clostridium sp. KNHs205]|uniref:Ig-like domain-containing protein n=1 Tax=Clostridium sp. KNHs205 TaxID=1449050 RepID=UPI00051AB407|nr:Ig-like domain-containing protein [Clostridium sp. KNHs205]
MKKFIILLLAIVLLLPVKVNAATVYTISSDNYTLFPKETIVLEILKNYEPVTGKIKWTSSNKKVATVTSKGKVTAKVKGKAVITATYGKKTYQCSIKVTASTEAVMIFQDNTSTPGDSSDSDDTGNSDASYITLSKYNSLNNGISYAEAVKLIGMEGSLQNTTETGDKTNATYVWYGKDGASNAVIKFVNDKLESKTQTSLQG